MKILFQILLSVLLSLFTLASFSQTTIYSASGGAWNDGGTWIGDSVPDPGDNAVIRKGHTVNLATGSGETINSLLIMAGGVLDVRNKTMAVTGTLIVNGTYTSDDNSAKDLSFSGDSLGGRGTIAINDASKYLNIGSDVVIIPTSHLHIFGNSYLQNNVTVTNKGHIEVTGNVVGQNATGSVWTQFDNSELEIAGSFLSTGTLNASATGNSVTFLLQGLQNIKTPGSSYYDLIISGSDVKTMLNDLVIDNDLIILSGTLNGNNNDIDLKGDWNNESDFLEGNGVVRFIGTTDQSISNPSGEQFFGLTINKSLGNLILETDVITTNTLNMTSGIIEAKTGKLTVGTGLGAPGAVVYTAGHIYGAFERWINSASTFTFPVGSLTSKQSLSITLNGLQTGGSLIVEFNESDPTNAGLPLFDNPDSVFNVFVDGYWDLSHANGFVLGDTNSYNIVLNGTGFTAFPINSSTRVLVRPDIGDDWGLEGTHQSPLGSSARRSGLDTIPAQYAFGDTSNCSRPVTSIIDGTDEVCTTISTGVPYSVDNHFPNTYNWIITGGSQVLGDSSNSIEVNWGGTGMYGNVRVIESNTCTQGAAEDFPVTIHSIQPTKISGKTSVAENSDSVSYWVSGILGYSYNWTIDGGDQFFGGNGDSIMVEWDSNGVGLVSVSAEMPGCPISPATELEINIYVIIESIATGLWDEETTWDCTCIPEETENVRINNSHMVTLPNGTAAEVNHFIIEAGGTLNTNNKEFYIHGDFIVNGTYQGGTKILEMDGFGKSIDGTGTITQTLTIDADINFSSTAVIHFPAGGNIAILDGRTVLNYGTVMVADNLTGETADSKWINKENATLAVGQTLLTTGILDASASGNVVAYNGAAAQTIKVPLSTYAHLATGGGGIKTLNGDIEVEEGIWLNGSSTLDVSGLNRSINLAGDWHNQGGTFNERSGRVFFDGISDQNIYGAETFYDLEFSNPADLVLDTNVTVLDSLIMDGGDIHPGTDTLKIGNGAGSPGAISRTSGIVTGKVERWITLTGTDYLFPIGNTGDYRPAELTFSNLSQNGSVVSQFIQGDPGWSGPPLSEGAVNISEQYTEGYWDMTARNLLTTNDYSLQLTATNFTSYTLIPGTRIIKRLTGGDWELDGVHGPGTPPDLFRNNMTGGLSATGTQFGAGHVQCPALTIDRVITDVNCFGGNDGAIDVTVNGGTAPYIYDWSNDSTSEDVTGLIAGSYDLNVRDADGCEVDSTFAISEPAVLNASLDSTEVTCLGGSDGSIIITAPSGGSGYYEYTHDGGTGWQSSGSFNGLSAGTYDVSMRDSLATSCILILDAALVLTDDNDITPPTVSCIADPTEVTDAGQCYYSVSGTEYDPTGSSDNCGVVSVTNDFNLGATLAGAQIPDGTTIQWTVQDAAGNPGSCSFTVTVNDTEDPSVTSCQTDITTVNDAGICGAVVNYALPVFEDNCDGAGLSGTRTVGPASGSTFPVGVTTVTYEYTDVALNGPAICSFIVTVNDTENPTVSCIADPTEIADAGQCYYTVSGTEYDPTGSSDNCGVVSVTNDFNLGATLAGAQIPDGTTIQWTVQDAAGNPGSCSFTVTVNDTEDPSVTSCQTDITTVNDAGICGAVVNYALPVFEDNCDGAGLSGTRTAGPASGSTFPLGVTTVTYEYTDVALNGPAICSFTVTVNDTENPSVTSCQTDITTVNDAGICGAVVNYALPVFADNCDGAGLPGARTLGPASGSTFPVGVTTVTYEYTDVALNGPAICSFTVTVNDAETPVASSKDATVYLDATGNVIIDSSFVDNGSADNCGIATATLDVSSFGCGDVGGNTVTMTVRDFAGLSDVSSSTVTVLDTISPVITCPGNQIETVDVNCELLLPDYTLVAGVVENCAGEVLTQTPAPNTLLSGHGTTQLVKLKATDASGNADSCTFTVTLDDITPPVASSKDTTVYLDATGNVVIDDSFVDNGSTDNCGIATATLDISNFTCTDVGGNTVTMTVTDVAGLSDVSSSTVTVLDTITPVVSCPGDRIEPVDANCRLVLPDYRGLLSVTENCAGTVLIQSPNPGTLLSGHGTSQIVTLTARDVSLNESSCTFTVTLDDDTDPVAICKDTTIYLDASGNVSIDSSFVDNGSADNCSIVMSLDKNNFTCSDLGINTVTMTVTDMAGLTDICSADVTVLDTISPVVTCPADQIGIVNTSCQFNLPDYTGMAGVTENCTLGSLVQTPAPGTILTGHGMTQLVTLTATDISLNTGQCSFTVTLNDTISPVISCPPDRDETADGSLNFTIPDYTSLASASDNCTSTPTLSQIPLVGTVISGIGTIQPITLTADDKNGNTSQCIFNITLLTPGVPTIVCPPDQDENVDASCQFILPDYTSLASTTGASSVSQSPVPGTILTGESTVQLITLKAKNVLNDSAECTFNVILHDTIAPGIICRNDTLVTAVPGSCSIVVTNISPLSGIENCTPASISYLISGATSGSGINDASGSVFNKGISTIWYKAMDTSGNSDSCSFTVTVLTNVNPPDSAYVDRDSVCAGDGSIQLMYGGGIMVEGGVARWYDDPSMSTAIGTGTPLLIAAPIVTTTYYLRFEGNCDTSSSVSAKVEVLTGSTAPTSAVADRINICPGDGIITLSYSGGVQGNGAIARWYADSALALNIGNGNNLSIVAPMISTDYFVRFEGECDTTGTAGFTLMVQDLSIAPLSAASDRDSVCSADGNIILSYTGGNPGSSGTAEWYTDSLFTTSVGSGNNLLLAAPENTTSYYIRFESDCDTSDASSIVVHTYPQPAPVFVEKDEQACFSPMLSRYVVSGLPGSSFTWNASGGTIVADYRDSVHVDWGNTPGTNDVSVFETSSDACISGPISVQVTVSGPTVDLGDDLEICLGTTTSITAQGDFISHIWDDNTTSQSYTSDTTEVVGIKVYNAVGCFARDSVQVTAYPTPVVFLGNDTTLCGEASLTLDAGNPGARYQWSTGEITREIEVFVGERLYSVEVTNGPDCSSTGEIIISECSVRDFFANIPNLFTPNGDGVNETWFFFESAAYPDIVIEIFDRWGKLVFRSEPGYSNPWDGRSMNGKELPMDSYHYIIKVGNEEITGTITIVR